MKNGAARIRGGADKAALIARQNTHFRCGGTGRESGTAGSRAGRVCQGAAGARDPDGGGPGAEDLLAAGAAAVGVD